METIENGFGGGVHDGVPASSLLTLAKRPLRDACLCMGELQAPVAPPPTHFVFLITL